MYYVLMWVDKYDRIQYDYFDVDTTSRSSVEDAARNQGLDNYTIAEIG